MDDYIFRYHIAQFRVEPEETSYFEIMKYSDPFYNTCTEHVLLKPEDFDNAVRQEGPFAPPKLKPGVRLLSGIRLLVQKAAQARETFAPHVISLPRPTYESMLRKMHLPLRAVESTAVVGPFFWAGHDHDVEDPHFQVVYRKSDVKKRGWTRGWELMLSYQYSTAITTGYIKGTPSSDVKDLIPHLKACASQVGHGMLVPIIILSFDLSTKNDGKQRKMRDWLRSLEYSISMREEIDVEENLVKTSELDLDALNRDLVECHSQVLWKRPQAYQVIIHEMEKAMDQFRAKLPPLSADADELARKERSELEWLHFSMMERLNFYTIKMSGTEHYIHTSLARLKIQRDALYSVIAHRESRINLIMAGEQKRLAHASKRDSTAMKTLSLLGAIFLPGTYLATVFSMTFFNFDGGDDGPVISPTLWVYFVIAIPLTTIFVGGWFMFDRQRQAKTLQDDRDLEKSIEDLGHEVMATRRKRTLQRQNTFNLSNPPPR